MADVYKGDPRDPKEKSLINIGPARVVCDSFNLKSCREQHGEEFAQQESTALFLDRLDKMNSGQGVLLMSQENQTNSKGEFVFSVPSRYNFIFKDDTNSLVWSTGGIDEIGDSEIMEAMKSVDNAKENSGQILNSVRLDLADELIRVIKENSDVDFDPEETKRVLLDGQGRKLQEGFLNLLRVILDDREKKKK